MTGSMAVLVLPHVGFSRRRRLAEAGLPEGVGQGVDDVAGGAVQPNGRVGGMNGRIRKI